MCDKMYICESSLYELFHLIALANTNIQYKQMIFDADNIDNDK